jgi:2-succinyl-6-hydroxy-2,4-cyclohexadiene-1-carboxylate synthase
MKTILNGVHYAFEVAGSGPSLLLLHGFTGSKATWKPFIPLWSQRYQTIAVDIIGHGESDSPEQISHYTMEAFADALELLLRNLGVRKTYVLGYSMGGRIALYLTVKKPDLIRGVLLESASPGLETKAERLNRIRQDEALADFIKENGLIAFVNRWESLPLFASQKTLPEHVKHAIRKERLSQNPNGLAASLRGMGTGRQPSLWEALPYIKQHVMLVTGRKDVKFVKIAERMKKSLPNSVHVIVEGSGHAVHVESPQTFGKIVFDRFYQIMNGKDGRNDG